MHFAIPSESLHGDSLMRSGSVLVRKTVILMVLLVTPSLAVPAYALQGGVIPPGRFVHKNEGPAVKRTSTLPGRGTFAGVP